MENKRAIKYVFWWINVAIVFLIPYEYVFSYSSHSTHPGLTDEMVDLFNMENSKHHFSDEEKDLINRGSTDEDEPVYRVLNHFYDPYHDIGLKGLFPTSKRWITDLQLQSNLDQQSYNVKKIFRPLFSSDTDFTWQRGIYEYVYGNKERALLTLGHILHHVEDMTVPDHTRNDAHPPAFDFGSPYEAWTSKFNIENIDELHSIVGEKFTLDENNFHRIEDIIDDTAIFSNENFFSKDTIDSANFPKPKTDLHQKITIDNETFVIKSDKTFLAVEDFKRDLATGDVKLVLGIQDDNSRVLESYWNELSKKAIANGTYTIDLFLKEIEKEKITHDLKNLNESLFQKSLRLLDGIGLRIYEAMLKNSASAIDAYDNLNIQDFSSPDFSSSDEPTFQSVNTILNAGESLSGEQNESIVSNSSAVEAPKELTDNDHFPPTQTEYISDPPAIPKSAIGGGSSPGVSNQFIENNISDGNSHATSSNTTSVASSSGTTNSTDVSTSTDNIATTSPTTTEEDINLQIKNCLSQVGTCLVAQNYIVLSWGRAGKSTTTFDIFLDGDIASSTISSTTIQVMGVQEGEHFLKINSHYGSTSTSTDFNLKVDYSPVIINEVAWAGTSDSSSHEWIELFNTTEKEINLRDFVLASQENSPFIRLTGVIPARDFYLIERKTSGETDEVDTSPISDIPADLWVSFGNGISNNGEVLSLSIVNEFGTTTIDKTPLCVIWCGMTSLDFHTFERHDSEALGEDQTNWGRSLPIISNGQTKSGNKINGTPKARNSLSYLINKNQNIQQGQTISLKKEDSPFIVDNTFLTILSGGRLVVDPDVVIKFYNDAKLVVNGFFDSLGTEDKPVTLTSFFDDAYAGDTNRDDLCIEGQKTNPQTTCPLPGDWFGLELNSSSTQNLKNLIIRYGGKYYTGTQNRKSNLVAVGFPVDFKNIVSEFSKENGVVFELSNSSFVESIVRNNGTNTTSGSGIKIVGGAPIIRHNLIQKNFNGLEIIGASSTIQNNVIEYNLGEAIKNINSNCTECHSNSFSSNLFQGIRISGDLVSPGEYRTLSNFGIPYVVSEPGIRVPFGAHLAIERGTIFKFLSGVFMIDGVVDANGTSNEPIIFTNIEDDSVGGDTLSNGIQPIIRKTGPLVKVNPNENTPVTFKFAQFSYSDIGLLVERAVVILEHLRFAFNNLGYKAISAIYNGIEDLLFESNVIDFEGDLSSG